MAYTKIKLNLETATCLEMQITWPGEQSICSKAEGVGFDSEVNQAKKSFRLDSQQ